VNSSVKSHKLDCTLSIHRNYHLMVSPVPSPAPLLASFFDPIKEVI